MCAAEAGKKIVEISLLRLTGLLNVCFGKAVTIAKFAMNISDRFVRQNLIQFGGLPRRSDNPNYIVGIPNS